MTSGFVSLSRECGVRCWLVSCVWRQAFFIPCAWRQASFCFMYVAPALFLSCAWRPNYVCFMCVASSLFILCVWRLVFLVCMASGVVSRVHGVRFCFSCAWRQAFVSHVRDVTDFLPRVHGVCVPRVCCEMLNVLMSDVCLLRISIHRRFSNITFQLCVNTVSFICFPKHD